MRIQQRGVTIRELYDGFVDSGEDGVKGFGGNLNIRPAFQREYVYDEKQRAAVIDTIRRNFPLNVMYWAVAADGSFELLDGQQRTMSICQYLMGKYSVGSANGNPMFFENLTDDEKEQIRNYELIIYVCEGSEREKLEWFRIINIAGVKLTDQELLNAVYSGAWLTDAKCHFSKTGCQAYNLASNYMSGSPIRQDYLETALDWIGDGKIAQYMADHQSDANAGELWLYFQAVIAWVESIFGPHWRKEMKKVPWGRLYNQFKVGVRDVEEIEAEVSSLMQDGDVTKKSGIYSYIFTREEKHLSIRAFSDAMKREAYERQGGVCPMCVAEQGPKTEYAIDEMEGDHATPWHEDGRTTSDNCQMLCQYHNRRKGGV